MGPARQKNCLTRYPHSWALHNVPGRHGFVDQLLDRDVDMANEIVGDRVVVENFDLHLTVHSLHSAIEI